MKPSARVDKIVTWRKLQENTFKANSNAAFNTALNKIGMGIVIKDFNVDLIAALSNSTLNHTNPPKIAEVLALRKLEEPCCLVKS